MSYNITPPPTNSPFRLRHIHTGLYYCKGKKVRYDSTDGNDNREVICHLTSNVNSNTLLRGRVPIDINGYNWFGLTKDQARNLRQLHPTLTIEGLVFENSGMVNWENSTPVLKTIPGDWEYQEMYEQWMEPGFDKQSKLV